MKDERSKENEGARREGREITPHSPRRQCSSISNLIEGQGKLGQANSERDVLKNSMQM